MANKNVHMHRSPYTRTYVRSDVMNCCVFSCSFFPLAIRRMTYVRTHAFAQAWTTPGGSDVAGPLGAYLLPPGARLHQMIGEARGAMLSATMLEGIVRRYARWP